MVNGEYYQEERRDCGMMTSQNDIIDMGALMYIAYYSTVAPSLALATQRTSTALLASTASSFVYSHFNFRDRWRGKI